MSTSARIDATRGEQTERRQTGNKEIVAPFDGDETLKPVADELLFAFANISGMTNRPVVADERIAILAEPEIVAVIYPLLLNEFELPGKARAHRHEDNSARLRIDLDALCEWSIPRSMTAIDVRQ